MRPEGDWAPPQWPEWQRPGRAVRPVVEGSGHIGACAAASCVVGVGTAVASWWLIGNLSPHTRPPEDLDYAFRAPDVPRWVVLTLGPIALIAVVASLGWLVTAASRRAIDGRWLHVVGLLAGAGFLLAGIGRVATAGSIGANIGGGLGIMMLPGVAGLVVWAAFIGRKISDAQRSQLST